MTKLYYSDLANIPPTVCPSSLDENLEPVDPSNTSHRWDDSTDPVTCSECGTTKYNPITIDMPFTKLYDFDEKPTERETRAVRDAIDRIASGKSIIKTPPHLAGQNDRITKEIAALLPFPDEPEMLKIISRVVYLSRQVIDDEDWAAKGYEKLTSMRILELHSAKRRIIVHFDGLFCNKDIELRPVASDAWLPRGNRTRGYRSFTLIDKYARLA